jgi:hypothetical protein
LRREAAGRYLSGLFKSGCIHEVLAKAIEDAKQEAHANGLANSDIDSELDAWRAEAQA